MKDKSNPTYLELIEFFKQKGQISFETEYMIVKDLQFTISLYEENYLNCIQNKENPKKNKNLIQQKYHMQKWFNEWDKMEKKPIVK